MSEANRLRARALRALKRALAQAEQAASKDPAALSEVISTAKTILTEVAEVEVAPPPEPEETVESIERWLRGLLHHADPKLLVWVAVACFEHSAAVREEFLRVLEHRASVAQAQEAEADARRADARASTPQPTAEAPEPEAQPVDGDDIEVVFEEEDTE